MGFLDFLKDVSKGATSALGSFVPIVGPAASNLLNSQYKNGGIVKMRKGGVAMPMAKGGLAGVYENLPGAVKELKDMVPQARQYLGLQNGGMLSTPLGKMMVMPSGGKKPTKKRVQKKKK